MLVLPLMTALTQGWAIGWASAPYDPHWAERYPKRAAIMSAAGPAGNLLIALLALGLLKTGLAAGWFIAPDRVSFDSLVEMASGSGPNFLTTVLSVFLVLNVFLGVFNLLPLPPLDGASVITLFLPEPLALRLRGFATNAMFSMFGLVVAWQVFPTLARPLFSFVLLLVHPTVGYGGGI
jgi:Zn-dependent protease